MSFLFRKIYVNANMPNPRYTKKFGNCNKPWRREVQNRHGDSKQDIYPNPYYDGKSDGGTAGKNPGSNKPENQSQSARKVKPPPGLKGKEIGLWYRDRQRKKNKNEEESNRMFISLDVEKREQIEAMLSTVVAPVFSISVEDDGDETYDHITDGVFKNNFLSKINGTFEDNLKTVGETQIVRDEDLDNELKEMYQSLKMKKSSHFQEMLAFRKKLPAYKKRKEIIDAIDKNQIIIISGETGCGKTTQVAQFILDHHIRHNKGSLCHVICTQPRRISAISVAERVAAERDEKLGLSVGYQIRLEKVLPMKKQGSILYVTTGVLLQWMHSNPALSDISHLVIDEIHERDTICDFLLTFLKDIIPKRPTLKVILMSATLNADSFSKYYGGVPTLHIEGFTFPVTEYYLEDVLEMTNFSFSFQASNNYHNFHQKKSTDAMYTNCILPYVRNLEAEKKYKPSVIKQLKFPESEIINIDLIEAVITHICKKEPDGAILVFLPGLSQIQNLHKSLTSRSFFSSSKFTIIPLHSIMPTTNQKQVFIKPPPGVRKIVIATNIAETSITIDDVVYVIDCGRSKMKNFDMKMNVSTLESEWESIANARQRRGRAGRVQPGKCYYLFTRARRDILEQYPLPEMQRTRLEEVILQAKMLQLGRVAPFLERVMDPPDPKAVQLSLQMLRTLNALDSEERLTPLGYHLAKLPMDPQTGKMILMGAIFSCADPIFSIAASLNFKDPFVVPLGKEHLVHLKKQRLSQGEKSDHFVISEALRNWEESDSRNEANDFAWDNFLSNHTLRLLRDMKGQFARHLHEMNYLCSTNPKDPRSNVNSGNIGLIKAIICSGLYPNVAMIRKITGRQVVLKTVDHFKVELHPKSLCEKIKHFESPFLVYHMKLKSSAIYLHDATMVYPMALLFFGERVDIVEDGKNHGIRVDNMIRFNCFKKTALLVKRLRTHLDSILENKITNPQIIDWTTHNKEEIVLRAIVELITTENKEMMMEDE